MVSRMLGVAPTIADAIIDQLSRPSDKAVAAGALLICLGLGSYKQQRVCCLVLKSWLHVA
jgi:hypothetical protein